MELILTSKHEILGSGYFLGIDDENRSNQLVIKIEDEKLLDKWAFIEFEVNNTDKYLTQKLNIENGQIIYDIPNGLLKEGYVKVQVILRDADGFVWKSFVRRFAVSNSINACNNLPDEYPSFINEAQKLLDGITIQADKVDEVLDTEASRVEAESIRVENENTRIANETNRSNAEQIRLTAEAERISNEETRQSNEVVRVIAETERETKFNNWENTLGVLDNLSNALKGTASGEVIRVDDVSPVEHNAKVKVQSKNLFDISQIVTNSNLTNNGDGTITTSIYSAGTEKRLSVLCPGLKVGDIVTLSFVSNSNMQFVYLLDVGTWYNGKTLTVTQNMLDANLYFYGYSSGSEFYGNDVVISNIQLEKGNTATEYTPYVNPTSVTVTRCGKNLLNIDGLVNSAFIKNEDGSFTFTKNGSDRYSNLVDISIPANTPVTFSATSIQGTADGFAFQIQKQDTTYISVTSLSSTKLTDTCILSDEPVKIRIYLGGGEEDGAYLKISGLQIELGDTLTENEQYKETETYTPNADGTLTITSTAPTMTLLTDKSGVNIELEYNQDINKVIKSLQDKINSLKQS